MEYYGVYINNRLMQVFVSEQEAHNCLVNYYRQGILEVKSKPIDAREYYTFVNYEIHQK